MKKSITIGMALCALMLTTSCSTRTIDLGGLSGKWNVISVNGNAVTPGADGQGPTMSFDVVNGRAVATTGCNRLMCGFNKDLPAGNLTFSRVASTMMACPDMSTEDAMKRALENTTGYVGLRKANEVALTCGGKRVMVLRKGYQDYSIATLEGKWRITELDGKDVKQTADEPRTVTFDKNGKYFCETGCNNLSGDFTTDYTAISFGDAMSTLMACPDMSTEEALSRLLPTVTSYGRLADGSLGFYNARNDMVLKLSR